MLYNLKNYKKENINPALIAMLEKEIMPSPDFTQKRADDCSLAVSYIFMWINAMYTFFKVQKILIIIIIISKIIKFRFSPKLNHFVTNFNVFLL